MPPDRLERFTVSIAALRMHLARLRGDLDGALGIGRIAELWAGDAEAAERHLGRAPWPAGAA